jgi:hypothetical protein
MPPARTTPLRSHARNLPADEPHGVRSSQVTAPVGDRVTVAVRCRHL